MQREKIKRLSAVILSSLMAVLTASCAFVGEGGNAKAIDVNKASLFSAPKLLCAKEKTLDKKQKTTDFYFVTGVKKKSYILLRDKNITSFEEYISNSSAGEKVVTTTRSDDYYLGDNYARVGTLRYIGTVKSVGNKLPDTVKSSSNGLRSDEYVYKASKVRFGKGSLGGRTFYAVTTDNKLCASTVLKKADKTVLKKNKAEYKRKFDELFDKNYSDTLKEIKKLKNKGEMYDSDSNRGKSLLKSADAADDTLKNYAGKLMKPGIVIDYGDKQYEDSGINDIFYVTWADGTEDTWDFDLRDVIILRVDNSIEISDDKPVIYLYPEKKENVTVSLKNKGGLTCIYPDTKSTKTTATWNVTADSDGTITKDGKTYNYLYWEGKNNGNFDFSKGFCVKGSDTAEFLDKVLDELGLTRKEANEFIVYWLPKMQDNKYNVISFQTKAYTDNAELNVKPCPDTVLRVFMAWHRTDKAVDIPEQKLTKTARKGFTVVEWGGSEVKNIK
ncbi:MAG: hypothetical protein ACI4CS_04715 [Candidatus Weimeria sp.]